MTGQPTPQANFVLVESLESSIQRGGNALADVPGLLKRVLREDAWREFATRRGELVRHEKWSSFVTTPPLAGLGADEALIDRIVGKGDPQLIRMLKSARAGKRGSVSILDKTDTITAESAVNVSVSRDRDADDLDRLARDHPDEYAAVERGDKSINAAAISAGIRRRRVPVRLDSPESAAETLRKHMPPEARRRLAELLTQENQP